MKKWINIEGSFLVDTDIDTFCQDLMQWLTDKGWLFAGVTHESDEEIPEELDDDEYEAEQIMVNPRKKNQH